MVMFKTSNLRFQIVLVPRLIVLSVVGRNDWSCDRSHDARLIVLSIVAPHDLSYHRSSGATVDRTLGHRMPRVIVRSVAGCHGWLIAPSVAGRHDWSYIGRSLIATTSRTISYDGSCHRYFPIVRNSSTAGWPLLEIVASIADRSHHGPIATNRTIQKSSGPVWLCGLNKKKDLFGNFFWK